SSRFVPGFRYGYWDREARGLELLKEWLSPEQFAQYDAKSYFDVTGCHSGKRYRINHGTSMNIHELDGAGRPRVGWCFAPKGYLVAGDVMLAQKIGLETDIPAAKAAPYLGCSGGQGTIVAGAKSAPGLYSTRVVHSGNVLSRHGIGRAHFRGGNVCGEVSLPAMVSRLARGPPDALRSFAGRRVS